MCIFAAMSTTISHQRAYSLPIEETYNINNDINHKTTGNGLSCKGQCNILNSNNCTQPPLPLLPPQPQPQSTTSNPCCSICYCNNNNNNNNVTSRSICKNLTTKQLQPVHQRTRSLPLTEETAISYINSNSSTVNNNNNINNNNNNNNNIVISNGHYLHHNQPIQPHHTMSMMMHNGSSNNQQQHQHYVAGAKQKSQSSSVIHYNNNNNYNNNNKINCSCMFSGNLTTTKGSLNNNCHLGAFYKKDFYIIFFFTFLFEFFFCFMIFLVENVSFFAEYLGIDGVFFLRNGIEDFGKSFLKVL